MPFGNILEVNCVCWVNNNDEPAITEYIPDVSVDNDGLLKASTEDIQVNDLGIGDDALSTDEIPSDACSSNLADDISNDESLGCEKDGDISLVDKMFLEVDFCCFKDGEKSLLGHILVNIRVDFENDGNM